MLIRLQVKKNLKKGESGVENASISKEISRKRTFVYKTQATETTGSFYGVADCSDMETEVSDELKTKKAKQVASKKKSKEGESGVEIASISKEISSKITFADENQTTDTTGSCHGIADRSDMESVRHTGLDPGYRNNDAVLPNDYCLTAGSDVADDDVTVMSETSWNDPSDVPTDDSLVDDFKEPSFRSKDREGNLFNPSIFF